MDPLEHLAVIIGIRRWVKPKDVVCIMVLR